MLKMREKIDQVKEAFVKVLYFDSKMFYPIV